MHTVECSEVILGCTDSTANNYDELATEDDGSCDYTVISYYSLTVSVDMSIEGFVAGDGSTWDGLDGSSMAIRLDGGTWVAMTDMGDNVWSHTFADLVAGDYTYNFNDGWYESGSFGDCVGGQYGNDRLATIVDMDVTIPTVCWESCEACPEVILGCTDSEASNYDAAATEDDGSCTYPAPMVSLFYSEYAEGSSSNKYFEIYNPSSEAVNLSDYTYNNCSNDCDGWEYSTAFAAGAIIPAGGTYSVCHPSFAGDQSLCDELATLYFNGNDAQGLVYVPTGEVLDVIGDTVGAAEYWSVAGVSSGTQDHTLVRKCSIEQGNSDWASSAGTDADDSEWIVLEQNDWSDLGMHTVECSEPVLGCTDASADNFDPNATVDDGSCTYCNSFEVVLLGTSDASAAGASDGSVQATGQGGSNNYDVSVVDGNDVPQNPFALAAGDYTVTVTDVTSGCQASVAFSISEPTVAEDPCDIVPTGLFTDNIIHNRVVFNWSAPSAAPSHYMIRYREVGTSSWTVMTAGPVNSNEFTGTSRTRYFMEPGTTYEWSMRARVLNEDGSTNCQSSWSSNSEYTTLEACANLENLSVDNVEANWVTFYADAPSSEWGVWQSKGKMRAVGTNAYRYVNGGSDGSITGVLKGNFAASTDYEWHTKSWCTGNVDANGDSDPQYHSGWGDFSAFTTEAPCDKMPTNLTTSSNAANTAVIMSWDTPASGAPDHYFLEMTNLTTGAVYEWNYQDGNSNSRTKFGQNPGDEISWRIRGACGTNGTSWATTFSQPVTYTLGGARLENSSVANLDVYPNPSRDIFNVTFTSEEAQTMTVKVVNMIGEEIFTEELTEFVGQYTQVIDMNTQPKGVYFLEITTSTGGINKKIVLQ